MDREGQQCVGYDPFAKPSENGRNLRQAAIRNGLADESPSSLKSNSQSPRLAMPSRTEAPTACLAVRREISLVRIQVRASDGSFPCSDWLTLAPRCLTDVTGAKVLAIRVALGRVR